MSSPSASDEVVANVLPALLRGNEFRLLDAVGQAVIVTDPQGRIIYWNRYAEQLYGWRADEVTGRSVLDVTPAASAAPAAEEIMDRLSRGESWQGDLEVRRKDGSTFWAHIVDSPVLHGEAVVAVIGLSSEVSTMAAAPAAADAPTGPQLRSLVHSVNEGYFLGEVIVDHTGNPVDFRFVEVNSRFEQISGLSGATGRTAREAILNLEPQWVENYARVGLLGQTMRFTQESAELGRTFDVFAVPVQPHGRFAVVFTDRTREYNAAQALRESERRLRTLVDTIDEGYCLCEIVLDGTGTPVDYRFLETNPHFEDMTGLPGATGRTAKELLPDLEPVWVQTYARAALGGETLRFERGSAATGRYYDIFVAPAQPPGQFVVVFRDLTQRRAAEESLRAAARRDAYRARLADALRLLVDPTQIQAAAARVLGEHLDATSVLYVEIDASGQLATVHADYHPADTPVTGTRRLGDYGVRLMSEFRAGRRVVVDDVGTDPRLTDAERLATLDRGVGAAVLVPLIKHGVIVAALAVHTADARRWPEEDLALIDETADRTWSAVVRARAEGELRRRHARAEFVAELLSELERDGRLPSQVQRLADLLVPRFADVARVEVIDGELTVLGEAADGESAGAPATSTLSVSLDVGGGATGSVIVAITSTERAGYDDHAQAFLQEIAERAGSVLAAARLRQQEHDISVRLQKALLPDRLVWDPNFFVEARYTAASDLLEVGGDWYDTFAWPDGHVGVVVGDVVGHNLDSAAAMGRLRAATAALASHLPPSPAALLDALGQFAAGPDGTEYATAVCIVVDPATGLLTYSSSGHPPALVVPPDGAPVRLTEAQNPPVCAISREARTEARVQVRPGSLVVLYSDGLVERRGESLLVGIERLEAVASRHRDEDIDVLADRLVHDLTSDSPPADDVVVACCRFTPPLEEFELWVPASPDRLAPLRAAMRGWLEANSVGTQATQDILLAVGEAASNAVEHAYPVGSVGTVRVRLSHHGGHVTARITDFGTWRPMRAPRGLRGFGLPIMKRLSRRLTRTTGPEGTQVLLVLPVRPVHRPTEGTDR